MQKERRYERFTVNDGEIRGKIMFANFVQIIDISMSGIALETEKRMNIGHEYTIKIERDEKILTVQGIVIWSLLTKSIPDFQGNAIPIYKAGMKFKDADTEKLKEILFFKENHEKKIGDETTLFTLKETITR